MWVSLQLDCICQEPSDSAIRIALKSLPSSLAETFQRILRKSTIGDKNGYHARIFKIAIAAYQPLTTSQLSEALSVTPGNSNWESSQKINDVRKLLSFCGNLLMVDEEDDTVRVIHHSVQSYFMGSLEDSSLKFTLKGAHTELASTVATYLTCGIFDQAVSTFVVPKIDSRHIPRAVAQGTIRNQAVSSIVSKLVFPKTSLETRDIGKTLSSASRPRDVALAPKFYPYARQYWPAHSKHVDYLALSKPQWCRVLKDPDHGMLSSFHARSQHSDQVASAGDNCRKEVLWCVANLHLPLLRRELHGRHGIYSLASLLLILKRLPGLAKFIFLDKDMLRFLFQVSVFAALEPCQKWILSNAGSTLLRESTDEWLVQQLRKPCFEIAVKLLEELSRRGWPQLEANTARGSPVLVEAVESMDMQMVYLLTRPGVPPMRSATGSALTRLVTSPHPLPVVIRMTVQLFENGLLGFSLGNLYKALHLISFSMQIRPDIFEQILKRLSIDQKRWILERACVLGNLNLARILIHNISGTMASVRGNMKARENLADFRTSEPEMEKPPLLELLDTWSPERSAFVVEMLAKLVGNLTQTPSPALELVLRRSIELRDWHLAAYTICIDSAVSRRVFAAANHHDSLSHPKLMIAAGDLVGFCFWLSVIPDGADNHGIFDWWQETFESRLFPDHMLPEVQLFLLSRMRADPPPPLMIQLRLAALSTLSPTRHLESYSFFFHSSELCRQVEAEIIRGNGLTCSFQPSTVDIARVAKGILQICYGDVKPDVPEKLDVFWGARQMNLLSYLVEHTRDDDDRGAEALREYLAGPFPDYQSIAARADPEYCVAVDILHIQILKILGVLSLHVPPGERRTMILPSTFNGPLLDFITERKVSVHRLETIIGSSPIRTFAMAEIVGSTLRRLREDEFKVDWNGLDIDDIFEIKRDWEQEALGSLDRNWGRGSRVRAWTYYPPLDASVVTEAIQKQITESIAYQKLGGTVEQ